MAPIPVSWVRCHHWTVQGQGKRRGTWWAGSLEPLANVVGPRATSLKAFCSWGMWLAHALLPPWTPTSILLSVSGVSFPPSSLLPALTPKWAGGLLEPSAALFAQSGGQ